MSDFLGALSAVFFPPRCIFCGEVVRYKETVCPSCAEALRACERTGAAVRGDLHCAAPYFYMDFVQEKLPAIKKREGRVLADWFAPRMADSVRRTFVGERIDWVTYVPNWEKEGERVYNQARVLARRVSRELSLPLTDALYQIRPKERQHMLSAAERLRNVQNLYALRDEGGVERVSGATVLLVDDIITTGSTLLACAQALPGTRILGAAVAVTEREKQVSGNAGPS